MLSDNDTNGDLANLISISCLPTYFAFILSMYVQQMVQKKLRSLQEIGRITRAEAYRTNFIDNGVAIIDAARNLDETIADAAKGLAGAIDAVFMEDRNPAEIYRDLNEQFDIVIEDFNTLSPADRQEVLCRIQGNLVAEGTKMGL